MSAEESATQWLHTLRDWSQSDARYQRAAWAVYHRYISRLIGLARKKLPSHRRRAADEEDVAHTVLEELFRGIREGRFSKLDDRHDLWQVLVMLTERRAVDHVRRETGQKRGGGRVRGESAFDHGGHLDARPGGIDEVVGPEPTPAFAAELLEELDMRLQQLHEAVDRKYPVDPAVLTKIAIMRLQRYTNSEIARELGCVERTVERRVEVIRQIWESRAERPDER